MYYYSMIKFIAFIMNKFLKSKCVLFILGNIEYIRMNIWPPALIPFSFGLYYSKVPFDRSDYIFALITFMLILSFTYSINNFVDRNLDKFSEKIFIMNLFFPKYIKYNIIVTLILILFISFFNNIYIIILTIISLIGAIFYSVNPFRMKGKPPLDLLLHVIYYGIIATLFGYYISNNILDLHLIINGISFGLLIGAGMILITNSDSKNDYMYGVRTISIILNEDGSIYLSTILYILSLLFFSFFNVKILIISILLSPMFILFIKKKKINNIIVNIFYSLWIVTTSMMIFFLNKFSIYHVSVIFYIFILFLIYNILFRLKKDILCLYS